jgi:hypothetical protein
VAVASAPVRSRQSLALRIVACVVVALIVGAIVGQLSSSGATSYESRAAVLFDQPGAVAASGDEGVILKLGRLRIKYADLVATDPLVAPTAERLHVPEAAVRGRLRAAVPQSSLLLQVIGRGKSAEAARALTAAAAASLKEYVAEEQRSLPAAQRITLTIVGEPRRGAAVGAGSHRRLALAGLAAAVTLVLAFIVLEAATSWRRRED